MSPVRTLPACLLAACAAGGTEPTDSAPEPSVDVLTVPPLAPELDPAEVAPRVQAALEAELLSPFAAFAWFEALLLDLGGGGVGCPHFTPSPFDPFTRLSEWQGACQGRTYSVAGGWLYQDRHETVDATLTTHAAQLLVSFTGSVPEGEVAAGGWAELDWTDTPDGHDVVAVLQATLVDPSQPAPWPGGVRGGTTWTGTASPSFEGTLDGPLGTASADVYFEATEVRGGVVTGGRIGLRDPSTAWWWLSFDESGDATLGDRLEPGLGVTLGAAIDAAFARDFGALP